MSCGRGCLAGIESFKTSFSLNNVAALLDSTRSVSLCQAINKKLEECDNCESDLHFTVCFKASILFQDLTLLGCTYWLVLAFCLSADCLPEKLISDG